MSFTESWIDQGQAPSLGTTLAAIDQGGIGAVNIYMGGRFAYLGGPPANGWTPAFVAQLAAVRPKVAFFGSWVSLSPGQGGYPLGFSDGLDAAAAARGYPMARWLSYDVEPSTFDANPQGAALAMHGFTDAVHSRGFLSMPYSVPRGLAAGAPGADGIWIANPNPGGEDPAIQPLNPAFFAGRRSVQCCQLTAAGVGWDLSHSQFSIGGLPLDQATFNSLMNGWLGTKNMSLDDLDALRWRVEALISNSATVSGTSVAAGEVNQLEAKLANLGSVADLKPVLDAVAALRADLDALTLKKV